MTLQEILSELRRLSLDERLILLEALTRSVRDDLNTPQDQTGRPIQAPPGSSLARVLGMLKPIGPMPTDEQLKEDYIC